jgi:hypothetical protein
MSDNASCMTEKGGSAYKSFRKRVEHIWFISHKSVAITIPLQAAALNENATLGHPQPISHVESPGLIRI